MTKLVIFSIFLSNILSMAASNTTSIAKDNSPELEFLDIFSFAKAERQYLLTCKDYRELKQYCVIYSS